MERLADEPGGHRDGLGRVAAKPALSDERQYANRLLVAYVETLVAMSGRGGLTANENAIITGTTGSLYDALGAVLATDRTGPVAQAPAAPQRSGRSMRWLLWAAGVVAMLLSLPLPVH